MNNKLSQNTQSLQSCVSVSVTDLRIGNYYSYDDDDELIIDKKRFVDTVKKDS